jgi:UDP-N-acetylglucosamine--N-acetylmuramyl-(pentapeptide) pyrophosphoryl-undecaprenol N-acetylglucosamine transferase
MMNSPAPTPFRPKVAAIACGGTGGHLFPGLAVGRELRRRGCEVILLVSSKKIDVLATEGAGDMEIVTLPAVGLTRGNLLGFAWGFCRSYSLSKKHFRKHRPDFILGMGGFTSAPPVLAGKHLGARTFLHESNSVPGRANRWLGRVVDEAFVYFQSASEELKARCVEVVGMPVRPEFLRLPSRAEARTALGLKPDAPVLLVMGGSQGAEKINELVLGILPQLLEALPTLQFIHLTGPSGFEKASAAYAARPCPAVVRPFLGEMDVALAAADAAVSRAGASSLAEFAACRLPAVLIPYPTAADDHQFHNARAFARSGAARSLQQDVFTPALLAQEVLDLLRNVEQRSAMRLALGAWHRPEAAAQMADRMLSWSGRVQPAPVSMPADPNSPKLEALNV